MQKRNTETNKGKSRTLHKVKITIQLMVLITLLATLGGILYFYLNYGKTILKMQSDAKEAVDLSTEDTFRSAQTSVVYDSEGSLISRLKSEKDVYYIKYEDIPTAVIDAMIVTEDRNFFEHDGVDYWANVRAAIALIKHKGHITQGASTITQQMAKNVFLTQEVTYTRKIKEIFVAQEMEKRYSKNQIMEFYLNGIYYANGHYGIQAAAQAYFDKGVSALSLSQIAFLSTIPNNPNLYNPLTKMDNALKRRDRILQQMLDNGKITQEQYQNALEEKIELKLNKADKKNYVETYAYYSAIRALMKQKGFEFRNQFKSEEDKEAYEKSFDELYDSFQKDLYTNGYRIYTSIDLEKQKLLQKSVDDQLANFTEKDEGGIYQMQGAAVCIDNDNGRVVAIVGGREQDLGGYTLNRAFQSFRQPGSSIKPLIVYTPSFERNFTPYSIVTDKYFKGGPHNSNGNYLGKIKLQKAVWDSRNTIAWKLFKKLIPEVGLSYLLRMNYSKIAKEDYTLASALGGLTQGVSPVEMASAYATLENDGYYRQPTCIVKIMDSEGNEIVGDTVDTTQVYETNASKIMTEVMTGVIKYGTARGLALSHTISAGKTGTTNDKKDGWFVGYTPYYTTSVWVGYDIPKSVSDLSGASYPGRIWHNYMEEVHTSSMTKKFEYYDWRAELKKAQEEKNKDKITPTIDPEDTLVPEDENVFNENTGNDTVDPGDTSDTGTEDTTTDDNLDNGATEDIGDPGDEISQTGDTGDNTGDNTGEDTSPDTNTGDDTAVGDNSNSYTQEGQTDDATVPSEDVVNE